MKNKIFLIFIITALFQLAVPIYLIAKREYVLRTGTPFLFSTRPVDPYDAFRGRYVTLSFDFETELEKKLREKYSSIKEGNVQKIIFVAIKKNPDGIALLDEISESQPDHSNYLKIKITIEPQYYYFLRYRLNFNKFYMDEFDAPEAEKAYKKHSSKKTAHALVYVRNGDTVLADLLIDNTPIRVYLKQHIKNQVSH